MKNSAISDKNQKNKSPFLVFLFLLMFGSNASARSQDIEQFTISRHFALEKEYLNFECHRRDVLSPSSGVKIAEAFDFFASSLSPESTKIFEKYRGLFNSEIQFKILEKTKAKLKEQLQEYAFPEARENYRETAQELFEIELLSRIGKYIASNALQRAADETHSIIAIRSINRHAYRYIALGAVSKTMAIKAKTANTGLIRGLIPVQSELSKTGTDEAATLKANLATQTLLSTHPEFKAMHLISIRNERPYIAAYKVDSRGKPIRFGQSTVQTWKTPEELEAELDEKREGELEYGSEDFPHWKAIQVLATDQNQLISSDADLAFVKKDTSTPHTHALDVPHHHATLGHTTENEIEIISAINAHIDGPNLVNHGSASHDPSHIPIVDAVKVFYPATMDEEKTQVRKINHSTVLYDFILRQHIPFSNTGLAPPELTICIPTVFQWACPK